MAVLIARYHDSAGHLNGYTNWLNWLSNQMIVGLHFKDYIDSYATVPLLPVGKSRYISSIFWPEVVLAFYLIGSCILHDAYMLSSVNDC